jgi:hypothetical protein
MRLTIGARRGPALVALVTILGALMLLARPAGAQSEINVFLAPGGRHTFQDVGEDGLRLGDRLTARFSLTDATGESTLGKGHLDCVVQRQIADGPEGPSGLYRCSYLLRLADGDLIIEGLDPHGLGVYTMAVLGGTGAFAGATGDATLTDTPVTTEFVISLIS